MDAEAKRKMFEEARRKGQEEEDRGLYAVEARVEETGGEDYLFIRYANGCEYRVPVRILQRVRDMSPEQRRRIILGETGDYLEWEGTDWDADIPALIAGCYGTVSYMETFSFERPGPTAT